MEDSPEVEFEGPRGRLSLLQWYLMHFEVVDLKQRGAGARRG